MQRKWAGCAVLGVALAGAVLYTGHARATTAVKYVGTTVALGRFGDIDILNQELISTNAWRGDENGPNLWMSLERSKGASDLYVQNNVWQPGGDTGWHSHPGHSLIIVTAGTVTDYESDQPDCAPTVYTQGMGFVDEGGDHVHLIRNEGSIVASTMAIQLIPANAARRIDAPAPANCHI